MAAEGTFLAEVLELLTRLLKGPSGPLLAGRDVAVLVDVDLALALQLEHQSLGLLEVGCHGVELGQLRLGRLEEVHLRLHVRLLRGVGLLLLLDLLSGASPLAGDLHHVRRDALGHYQEKQRSKQRLTRDTYG